VAIAAAWQTVATIAATTTVATCYTIPTTPSYIRDLVVTNSGAPTLYVCLSVAGAATAAASFQLPSGGSLVLTECQVPASAVIGAANTTSTAGSLSVGYGSLINVT
jgi:hypothetical protein